MRSATRLQTGRDRDYLAFIASQPCVVCILPWRANGSGVAFSNVQQSRTEVAHVGDRGFSVKCSDRETIPLCAWHHRAGPESHHRLGKRFWAAWGLDKEALISHYQKAFEDHDPN